MHCAASCAPFLVEQKTSANFPFECCISISKMKLRSLLSNRKSFLAGA
uniref:Uncharacterized protein n=1 Tax=Arundo donax TaxID=35708 RepID=A0A0A9E1U4_ARUDO